MICDVHGCPACIVTLPISSKCEPVGAAFAAAVGLGGCAQLAPATVMSAIANENAPDFIE